MKMDLSTLQSEVQFVQSYYRLLQTRHGDAVQLNIQIDKRYDLYLLAINVVATAN